MKYYLEFGAIGDCGKRTAICLMKRINDASFCIAQSIWVLNYRGFKTGKLLLSLIKSRSQK